MEAPWARIRLFLSRLFRLSRLRQPPAGDIPKLSWEQERAAMVKHQIEKRGVRDRRVLEALGRVPRHLFVPEKIQPLAYADKALAIGYQQTISQPYVVAVMTERLGLRGDERVLEIGTGSGYQAAVLSALAAEVYTVELIPELAQLARQTLRTLGFTKVQVRTGNGWQGWPEEAPFDLIMVTAAAPEVPPALATQVKTGGRLVMPVGAGTRQNLYSYVKTPSGLKGEMIFPVRFVPFVKP